ncbi:hypothetical protein [Pseudomonas alkylphenolica]|uniref:hypothetical protein n=1 Tax=Pseudomonas alkylphenolica TaxID=237609 RepID=UPI00315CF155
MTTQEQLKFYQFKKKEEKEEKEVLTDPSLPPPCFKDAVGDTLVLKDLPDRPIVETTYPGHSGQTNLTNCTVYTTVYSGGTWFYYVSIPPTEEHGGDSYPAEYWKNLLSGEEATTEIMIVYKYNDGSEKKVKNSRTYKIVRTGSR